MASLCDLSCQLCSVALSVSSQNGSAIDTGNTKLFWNYLYHKNVRESISCGVGEEETANRAKFTFSLSIGKDGTNSDPSVEQPMELCQICRDDLEKLQEFHQLLESTKRRLKCEIRKIEERINAEVRQTGNYNVLKICDVPNFHVSMGGSVVGRENISTALEFVGNLCHGMSKSTPNSAPASKLPPGQVMDQSNESIHQMNNAEPNIQPPENSSHPAPEVISDSKVTRDVTVVQENLKVDKGIASAATSIDESKLSPEIPEGLSVDIDPNETRKIPCNVPANEIVNQSRCGETVDSEETRGEMTNQIATEPIIPESNGQRTGKDQPNSNTSPKADTEITTETQNDKVPEMPNEPIEFELIFLPTQNTPDIPSESVIEGALSDQLQSITSAGDELVGSPDGFNLDAIPPATPNMPTTAKRGRGATATFLCHVCGKLIKGELMFFRHLAYHRNDRAFHCAFCCRRYVTQSDLDRHRVMHTGEFKCGFCRKRFFQFRELEDHAILCRNERPFPCNFCCRRFKRDGALGIHKVKVHDKPKKLPKN